MSGPDAAQGQTPLARRLAAEILADGPIPVAAYMARCLGDPEHGYYRHATAIGPDGDFITAPEISQMFGEIVGLWAAVVWQQMGRPARVHLVELGPGRGTMMRDMLRAARLAPEFLAAAEVTLVESHPRLRETQRATLGGAGKSMRQLETLGALAALAGKDGAPAIIVANELIDALPAEQAVLTGVGWRRRTVGIDAEGGLAFGHGEAIALPAEFSSLAAREGDIVTLTDPTPIIGALQGWPAVAALLIDYGQEMPAIGDTLQAVRAHAIEHPLASPGEADLSCSVDFATVARAGARIAGLAADGPVTQAEFLGALGIVERASRLMAANPCDGAAIEAEVARLLSPSGMGGRFKALGLRSAGLPPLPGLALPGR